MAKTPLPKPAGADAPRYNSCSFRCDSSSLGRSKPTERPEECRRYDHAIEHARVLCRKPGSRKVRIAVKDSCIYPRPVNAPGRLLGIFIAAHASELPRPVERARALAGRGLEGDRYASEAGTFSTNPGKRDVTLIESEALASYERESGKKLAAAEARRNLLTQGVRLNDLVGREFTVGPVRMRGLRLSEPCSHLARLTHAETLDGLAHRGGLVAEILNDGELKVGDEVSESSEIDLPASPANTTPGRRGA